MSLPVRILAIGAVVVVLLVALLETVPRLVAIPGLRLEDLDPAAAEVASANVRPHPYLAYSPTPDYRSKPGAAHEVAHNSLGFRGPETSWQKPEGVFRIACLGGSSTYGHGPSSNATTWPARLEARLNEAQDAVRVEVVNGGCRGYSTFESLGNLSFRMLDLEPDLVLVYHTINDMRCALYGAPARDNTHWRAVWPVRRETALEKSWTWLVLRRYLTDYVAQQRDLGSYVIVDFDGSTDPYAWPPGREQGFRNFHRNLESIIAAAGARGAGVVLATQATRRSDIGAAGSGPDQLRAFDYMTEILGIVAREHGLLLVDAQAALQEEAARRVSAGADPAKEGIFTNDVHLTDEGADLLARTFAEALLAAGLVR